MGDPKRQRKKYQTPLHPWKKDRLDEERQLITEYGLKNKKELWKFESLLRKFKSQAKKLIARSDEQAEKEEKQLLDRLYGLNLLNKDAKIEDVLALSLEDLLDRRLQTMVFKQNLVRSIKQSRQFVVHGHIFINNRKVDVPSYIVLRDEEDKIEFNPRSSLASSDHPERVKEKKKTEKEKAKKTSKEKPKKDEKKSEKKSKDAKGPKGVKVPKAEDLVKKKEEDKEEK